MSRSKENQQTKIPGRHQEREKNNWLDIYE